MKTRFVTLVCALTWVALARGQTILLDSVIGSAGTDALSVRGAGNRVNWNGVASNSGATTLTAAGSTGSSSFDFNSGFSDHIDRAIGLSPNVGSNHVYADRGWNSSVTTDLILDRNNDGFFTDEVDNVPGDPSTHNLGFGLHADGFITFDLAAIRTTAGLAANTAFTLTGGAGVNNNTAAGRTSGAIILDSTELAVFDWQTAATYHQFDTFSLSIPGTARYLTFAGLVGQNGDTGFDHVSFADVTLTAVPEPPAMAALAGMVCLGALAFRRRRRQAVPPK